MIRRVALVTGWMLVSIIVFSTLSPIGLRPKTGFPDLERFVAFLLAGASFAVAYPNRRGWVLAALVVGAGFLEVGQLFVPGRDGHLHDAIIKATGGIIGVASMAVAEHLAKRTRIGTIINRGLREASATAPRKLKLREMR